MKDPLKNFNAEKTLKQLSDSTIDQLLTSQAGIAESEITAQRQAANKKALLEYQTNVAVNNLSCYKVLRTAFFFHQHSVKVPSLCAYLTSKGAALSDTKPKSHADHVCQLYLAHPQHVAEYFTICLHTCQSKRYMQRRDDYIDPAISAETAKTKLTEMADKLVDQLKTERGTAKKQLSHFEHEDKLFAIMEFNDTPTVTREFDKDQPQDQFRRFALDLTFVFDLKTGAVDVIANTTELRQKMHRTAAAVIYGKESIPAHPPKNEVFDLQKLMELIDSQTPIAHPTSKSGVVAIYVNELTLRQISFPNMKFTVRSGTMPKVGEARTDFVKNAHDMLTSLVDTRGEASGWRRKSNMELTHAELIALYWDQTEKKDMSKAFTINSTGNTNLGHDDVDESIKQFLREVRLLKEHEQSDLNIENSHESEQPAFVPSSPV